MFCSTCPDREQCREICGPLEEHLSGLVTYQRELPLDPSDLALVAENVKLTLADVVPDAGWLWERLAPRLVILPARLLVPFLMCYREGMGVSRIARELGVHRTTIHRRLRLAMESLKSFDPGCEEFPCEPILRIGDDRVEALRDLSGVAVREPAEWFDS